MIKKHSELSPSSSERWWNCPGSIALCRGIPDTEPSPYMLEGTVAHEVLERVLKHKANAWDLVGTEIKGIEVSDEMAEAVSVTVDLVIAELQKGGFAVYETPVKVRPDIKGTLDIAIVKPLEKITIIDFKYGKGVVVRAEYNYQMMLYLIGMMDEYECEKAEIIISQPRVGEGDNLSRWECDIEYVKNFNIELDRRIQLTKEKEPPLQSGDWCKFCKAKVNCPALRQELLAPLSPIKGKELIFPDVRALSVENISTILDVRDKLEDWLSAVASYAQTILEAGGDVPNYMLAKKRAIRKWISEQEVAQKFAHLGDKIFNIKLLSPAQLEKIVGKPEVADLTEIPDNGFSIKRKR